MSPDTLNLDPEKVAKRLTPRTRAILPVDYAGHPAEMDAFLKLAADHDLIVIEDACHALGAEYQRQRTGSIADMTVFSFHPVKHLATGEGGMVTTARTELTPRLCGSSAIMAFRATHASASPRDSGVTRWCCSVLTIVSLTLRALWDCLN